MSEYITNLRKIVGKIPIILSTAGIVVIDNKGRILLQLRSDNELWGLPGGCIELGETVEETARREVYEETGLIAEKLEFLNIYSGEQQHYFYPNGDEVYFISTVYITRNYKGVLNIDENESKEVAFFDIERLPQNIVRVSIPVIKDLKKRLGCS